MIIRGEEKRQSEYLEAHKEHKGNNGMYRFAKIEQNNICGNENKKFEEKYVEAAGDKIKNKTVNINNKNIFDELKDFISPNSQKIEIVTQKAPSSQPYNQRKESKQVSRKNSFHNDRRYKLRKISFDDLFANIENNTKKEEDDEFANLKYYEINNQEKKDIKENTQSNAVEKPYSEKPWPLSYRNFQNFKRYNHSKNYNSNFYNKHIRSNLYKRNSNNPNYTISQNPNNQRKASAHDFLYKNNFVQKFFQNNNPQNALKYNSSISKNVNNNFPFYKNYNFKILKRKFSEIPRIGNLNLQKINAKLYPTDISNDKISNNKYDMIFNNKENPNKPEKLNVFNLWDEINAKNNLKKKWFIKSNNGLNYGPFSNEEIYNFLKTNITTNSESEILKNSIIIDSEMDIYFKPDSAFEVLQQDLKNCTLPAKPVDNLEKILIKIDEDYVNKNNNNHNILIQRKIDSISKEAPDEVNPTHENEDDELKAKDIINSEAIPQEKQEEATDDLGAKEVYDFIYQKQNRKLTYENTDKSHCIKLLGAFKETEVNDLFSKDHPILGNNPDISNKKDLRRKKMQSVIDKENIPMNANMNVFDKKRKTSACFTSVKNKILSDSLGIINKQNYTSHANKSIKFNKFDEKDYLNNKEDKENKKPNISAVIKPISIDEIFASAEEKLFQIPSASDQDNKEYENLTQDKKDLISEIKEFLSCDQKEKVLSNKNSLLRKNSETITSESIKNLIDLGITTKIEFKTEEQIRKERGGAGEFHEVSNNENQEKQLKHFLGAKVDGKISRNLEIYKSISSNNRKYSASNKFDIPLNKIAFTRKFSHATTQSSNSSYGLNSKESSPNMPTNTSPNTKNEESNDRHINIDIKKDYKTSNTTINVDDLFQIKNDEQLNFNFDPSAIYNPNNDISSYKRIEKTPDKELFSS